MQIGTFVATADGFEGRLTILALHTELTLVPAEPSDSENAPDYRVLAGDWGDTREVGAGWKRIRDIGACFLADALPSRAKLARDGSASARKQAPMSRSRSTTRCLQSLCAVISSGAKAMDTYLSGRGPPNASLRTEPCAPSPA